MEKIINQELIPLINNGQLSIPKIHSLISLREFINRIASKPYMRNDDISKIHDKYHVFPTVTSWGDYFQVELVHDILNYPDNDFIKAINTVKFDIISSHIIFSEKRASFFRQVNDWYDDISSKQEGVSLEDYEEICHLKILKDYYVNLGIEEKFTSQEINWYEEYKEAVAV